MKNKVQTGNVMDWFNNTGAPVLSGTIVRFGAMIGIAVADIADQETGALDVEGVFELPKTTALAMAQGTRAFVAAGGLVTATGTDAPAGVVFKSALSADSTVQVKLNAGIST